MKRISKSELKDLVSMNKQKKAISYLLSITEGLSDDDLHTNVILISSKLEKYKENTLRGVVTQETDDVSIAKINSNILQLIDSLPSETEDSFIIKNSLIHRKNLLFLMIGILLILIVYFFAKPVLKSDTKRTIPNIFDELVLSSELLSSDCVNADEVKERWKLGDFKGALSLLETCPHNAWVLKEKANNLLVLGEFDKAKDALIGAYTNSLNLAQNKDKRAFELWLVIAQKRIKIFREEFVVIPDAENLTRSYDKRSDLWHIIGLGYYYGALAKKQIKNVKEERECWEKAEEAYSNSIARGSTSQWTWLDKLDCMQSLNRDSKFIDNLFIEAIKKFPDQINVESRYRLRWIEQENR